MEDLVQVYFFTIPDPILYSHIGTQSNVCVLHFLRYVYNLIKIQWSFLGYVNSIVLWRQFVYNTVVCFLRVHPSTAFRTLLLTMMATPFLLRDSCPQ